MKDIRPLMELDENPGDECFTKTALLGLQGAAAGGAYGAAAAAFMEPTKELPALIQALRVIGSNALLIGGVASTFSMTTCVATSLRDKDDWKNWSLGGAAAGSIFGFRFRSIPVGSMVAAGLATAMGVMKYTEVYKNPIENDNYLLRSNPNPKQNGV